MKIKFFIISMVFTLSVATAGKFDQTSTNRLEAKNASAPIVPNSTPNSSVVIDFGVATGESWDAQGGADNVVANCMTGGSVTGIEWTNVTVETVGASWLSEATMGFGDTALTNGVNLSVGNGDDFAGTMTYSSGGIIDLTDNAIPDIVPAGDGIIQMELFEGFDDVAGAIDANYTAGTVTVWGIDLVATPCDFAAAVALAPPTPVPATNLYLLIALFFMLTIFGRKFIKS